MRGQQGSGKMQSPFMRGRGRLYLFTGLLSLSALAALAWLLLIPAENGTSFFLHYSLPRLAAVLVLLAVLAVLLFVNFSLYKETHLAVKLRTVFMAKKTILWTVCSALIVFLLSWSLLFFFHLLNISFNPYLKIRLMPITCWLLTSSLIILTGYPRLVNPQLAKTHKKFNWLPALIFFILILAVMYLVFATGLGFAYTTMRQTVSDLGVPLFEWQILYTYGLVYALLTFHHFLEKLEMVGDILKKNQRIVDLLFFIFIWLLAAVVWLKQPLPVNNYFAPTAVPPNYETYPFSDAQRYSLDALQLLYGDTRGEVISKPLYVIYLASLHLLGGLDYEKIIRIQTLILALFPAVLYLIGKQIGNRVLGLGAGLLAIFRELNFIQMSNVANVSNSKLLMTDFPYTLGISIVALLTVIWVKRKQDSPGLLLLLGGMLALNCMLRAQTLILIPLFIFLILIKYWKRWKKVIYSSFLLVSMLLATLLPLLVRNYAVSGFFWFDDSDYMSNFLSNYVMDGMRIEDADLDLPPMNADDHLESSLTVLLNVVDHHWIKDVTGNFIRNFLSAVMQFPIRLELPISQQNLISFDGNFWKEPERTPSPLGLFILGCNCLILALGIGQIWKQGRSLFAVLFGLFILINISSALFCFSGWRFIMPVDWLFYLFYLTGVCLLFNLAAGTPCLDKWQQANDAGVQGAGSHRPSLVIICACFLLVGSLIPIREAFMKPAPESSKLELCSQLSGLVSASNSSISEASFMDICTEEDSVVAEGRVIYPRYFKKDYGYVSRPNVFYGTLDYGRLSFYFLDEITNRYYLPLDQWKDNDKLPNGSEAIILTTEELQPELLLMAVISEDGSVFTSSTLNENIVLNTK